MPPQLQQSAYILFNPALWCRYRFVNLQNGSWRATVLVENPCDSFVMDLGTLQRRAAQLLDCAPGELALSRTEGGAPLTANGGATALAGQTVFVARR